MKNRFVFFALVGTLSFFVCGFSINQSLQNEKWKSLFDGKTLKGWHSIPGGEWKVENGAIVGVSDKADTRHGLLVTDQSFRNFEIRIEYKAIKGNSGLYFRAEEVGGLVGVHGFQAEIDPDRDAGGLYETGGREWVVKPTAKQVQSWYKPGQWNNMTVHAEGGHITVYVNGKKTAELFNDTGRTEGRIALQLHGSMDMHTLFKRIMIREL